MNLNFTFRYTGDTGVTKHHTRHELSIEQPTKRDKRLTAFMPAYVMRIWNFITQINFEQWELFLPLACANLRVEISARPLMETRWWHIRGSLRGSQWEKCSQRLRNGSDGLINCHHVDHPMACPCPPPLPKPPPSLADCRCIRSRTAVWWWGTTEPDLYDLMWLAGWEVKLPS